LTCEEIRLRCEQNIAAVQGERFRSRAAWAHHGPPPGGNWMEVDGARWRLREEDFVFERVGD